MKYKNILAPTAIKVLMSGLYGYGIDIDIRKLDCGCRLARVAPVE